MRWPDAASRMLAVSSGKPASAARALSAPRGSSSPLAVTAGLAAAVAAWMVRRYSPHASGSGIPHVEAVLKRPVVAVGQAQKAIKSIAWCSGGAQGYFESAIAAGVDAFITGEISEPQAHLSRPA